jgi:hypothetical protein
MSKKKALADVRNCIDDLLDMVDKIQEIPSSVFDKAAYAYFGSSRLFIGLPFDLATYREVRRALSKLGWHAEKIYGTASRYTKLVNDEKHEIVITMGDHLEGSTCKKVKTGTKFVPGYHVDEYKVVCE